MKSSVLAIVFDSALTAEQKVDLAMKINAIGDVSGLVAQDSAFLPLKAQINEYVGKYCIVRTYSAGVHCGEIVAHAGTEVILKLARRIHYWEGAFTLNAIALNGAGDGTRLSVAVPEILLTEAIEILPCTENGAKWLSTRKEHTND